ncbi:MAG TPA: hypothetical protein VK928_13605 [Longimicrobiales bacterium]|nr:hypothetical protein [Longimicrobiales bacterium]
MAMLFTQAFLRLGARGVSAMRDGLSAPEWAALVVLTVVFVYGEGVRALQRRWVPHALTRLDDLPSQPVLHRILAPLYGMSLVGAPRRILALAWGGVVAIIAAVLIVSRFPDPWRGITDFAVAAALAWASVALVVGGVRRFTASG